MARKTRSTPRRRAGTGHTGDEPQSWVDRLTDWVAQTPGAGWLFYGGVTIAFVILGHGLRWLDGSIPYGEFDGLRFANDVVTVYALALLQYLNATARRALTVFRPALGTLESQYHLLHRALTRMSQRGFVASATLGLVLAVLSILADPGGWGITADASAASRITAAVQAGLEILSFVVLVSHVIQQLRIVRRIHREASGVSLYGREANHAFSILTVRAAIGLVAPVYFYSFVVLLTQGALGTMSAVDSGLVVVLVLLSAAVFILPLSGMRRRLQNEKSRLMQEADWRVEATSQRLHSAVDSGAFGKTRDLAVALSALKDEKQQIRTISTWPWDNATLRGFLSSIGIPVFLWFITTYLGRWLGN
jgi:hypothetical protein